MGAQVETSAEAISSFYFLFLFLERMGCSIYFCFFFSALHFLAVFFHRGYSLESARVPTGTPKKPVSQLVKGFTCLSYHSVS